MIKPEAVFRRCLAVNASLERMATARSRVFTFPIIVFYPVECRMIQPVQVAPVTTQVLTIGLLDRFETGQSIGYHRATTGNMPFCPISNGLGFETIDHRHPHLDWMSFLVQGHCCHKRRLACRARPPFATTALATPVDIIRLNDAADGLLVIGLFHGLQQLVLEHPGGVIFDANWRFSSIADKPVLVCDNRCIARNRLVSGTWCLRKSCFQSMTSGDGSDCIATWPPSQATTGLVGTFRANKAVGKTPSEQRFALSLSAMVIEKLKQAVAFLELDFAFGR